jgi:predicted metalloendopeptidase
MVKTAMLLGAKNKANVVKQMNEVLQFERSLAKVYELKGKLKDSEDIYNKMTIADLQQMAPSVCSECIAFFLIITSMKSFEPINIVSLKFDYMQYYLYLRFKIPWMDYMNNIFSSPVTFSEPVVVYTPHYLRNMSELVTKTERR